MKKRLFIVILCFLVIITIFFHVIKNNNNKDSNDMKKITLAEVAHTIFYAPMYVSLEKGYFKENGIDVELILTSGTDKVSAALLSGYADIGLCRSEATIYVYNG